MGFFWKTIMQMSFQNTKTETLAALNAGNIGPSDKETYYSSEPEGNPAD